METFSQKHASTILRYKLENVPDHVEAMFIRHIYSHWHHLETLRQLFAGIVATVVVAFLAFVGKGYADTQGGDFFESAPIRSAIVLIWIVSIIGLAMTFRMNRVIKMCGDSLRDLYAAYDVKEIDIVYKLRNDPKLKRCPYFRIRNLYMFFHTAIFLLFSYCIVCAFGYEASLVLGVSVSLAFFLMVKVLIWRENEVGKNASDER